MKTNKYFRGEVKNNQTGSIMYVNLINSTQKERADFKKFYRQFIENGVKNIM